MADVRVLDFGRYVAGPYCATLLGDFGAEVIRIEKREGSEDRFLMPVSAEGEGALFLQMNRNKQSMTLDPASEAGREVVRRLVRTADVVVVNMPTDAVAAMGLDYPTLQGLNPRIILANLSAFGKDGPWRDRLGFDSIGQAMSGSVYLNGEPDQPYRTQVTWVDYASALHLAVGVMVALLERTRSGLGQEVSGALLATAVAMNASPLIEQALAAPDWRAIGNRSFTSGPTDLFQTLDGWIAVHVVGQPLFRRWARLMGEAARWLDDPRFADDSLRGRNGAALSERMAAWCADKTRDQALDALAAARIPAGPVLSPAQVLVHPQVAALGLLQAVDYPGLPSPAPIAGVPVFLSRTPAEIRTRPPQLGEHTDDLLASLGYDAQAIADLRRLGAI